MLNLNKPKTTLEEYISLGTYILIRHTGHTLKEIFELKSSQFQWMLEMWNKEQKEAEKQVKKNAKSRR